LSCAFSDIYIYCILFFQSSSCAGEYGGEQDPDKLAAEYEAFESLIGNDKPSAKKDDVSSHLPLGLPTSIPDPLQLISNKAEKKAKAEKVTKENSSESSSEDSSDEEDDSSDDSNRYSKGTSLVTFFYILSVYYYWGKLSDNLGLKRVLLGVGLTLGPRLCCQQHIASMSLLPR
jgi:hypothetical protein